VITFPFPLTANSHQTQSGQHTQTPLKMFKQTSPIAVRPAHSRPSQHVHINLTNRSPVGSLKPLSTCSNKPHQSQSGRLTQAPLNMFT